MIIQEIPYLFQVLEQIDSDLGPIDFRVREQGVKAAEILGCKEWEVMILDNQDPLWMNFYPEEEDREILGPVLFTSDGPEDEYEEGVYILWDGPTVDGVHFLIMGHSDGGDEICVYARKS